MDKLQEIEEIIKDLKKKLETQPENEGKLNEMISYWEDLYDELETLREMINEE